MFTVRPHCLCCLLTCFCLGTLDASTDICCGHMSGREGSCLGESPAHHFPTLQGNIQTAFSLCPFQAIMGTLVQWLSDCEFAPNQCGFEGTGQRGVPTHVVLADTPRTSTVPGCLQMGMWVCVAFNTVTMWA